MKTKIVYSILALLMFLVACQKPDAVVRNTDNTLADGAVWLNIPGYNSNPYVATFNTARDSAFINIPYYYPETSNNEVNLKTVLVRMNIPYDAKVTPALDQPLDLTSPVRITVTSGSGVPYSFVLSAKKVGNYSISKISIKYSAVDSVDGIINGTDVLFFIVPGTNISASKLTYTINPHSTGSIANGSVINLATPMPFTVTGADGKSVTYTLKAQAPTKLPYGIGIYRKLWYMPASQIANTGVGTGSNETAIAVSGNYLLILNNLGLPTGSIKVYDRLTMAYVRNLAMPAAPAGTRFFGMHSDSTGAIIVSSFAPTGSILYIYKYASAMDDNPVKLVQFAYSGTANTSLGRTIRVYGDLSKDAVITSHISASNIIAKWQVTNGAVVSQTPVLLTYGSLTMPSGSTTSWGNYAEAIMTGTSATANYFLHYPGELAYVNGTTNTRISGYNVNTSGGVVYQYPLTTFRFNNANYLLAEMFKGTNNVYAYFSLYDVTDLSKFGTPAAKVLDSDVADMGASNGNGTGDVAAIVSADGTKAHVYMMLTNGGIMCYELTLYSAN